MDTINISIVEKENTNNNKEYVDYFSKLKNVNFVPFSKVKDFFKIDVFVFTGGADVYPDLYRQGVGRYTNFNEERDVFEKQAFGRIPPHCLKIGICRGAQFLTVMNGGKLIQHVTGHLSSHTMSSSIFPKHIVTSSHHQMMFPFNLHEDAYDLIGWSEFFKSETYLDGNNKEIELPENFLEPEIVYYKSRNSLCIQSHPEWDIDSSFSKELLTFIKNLIFENGKK